MPTEGDFGICLRRLYTMATTMTNRTRSPPPIPAAIVMTDRLPESSVEESELALSLTEVDAKEVVIVEGAAVVDREASVDGLVVAVVRLRVAVGVAVVT